MDKQDHRQESPSSGHPAADKSAVRRRLLKGGLSAAPVVLSLSSRPVLAGGLPALCTTPSGFASINLSKHNHSTGTCSGRTPGYWKNAPTTSSPSQPSWPYPPSSLFKTYFSPSLSYGDLTLLQALQCGGNASGEVALVRHITAALLNAAAGLTPAVVLDVSRVKAIWQEFAMHAPGGYYEPMAGVKWYADDIVTYLTSTMPM
jgi:hypothetical protein